MISLSSCQFVMPSCATTSDDLCTSLTVQLFPVAGISVCSSETSKEGSCLQANSTNTMQDDKQGKYSQDFVPGCGFTLAGLVDLINIHPNCELCLEEFFDKDDDDSFTSESYYSVYDHASVNTDIVTNKKATYQGEGFSSLSKGSWSHKEQIEMLAKSPLRRKRRLVYSLKRRAEV